MLASTSPGACCACQESPPTSARSKARAAGKCCSLRFARLGRATPPRALLPVPSTWTVFTEGAAEPRSPGCDRRRGRSAVYGDSLPRSQCCHPMRSGWLHRHGAGKGVRASHTTLVHHPPRRAHLRPLAGRPPPHPARAAATVRPPPAPPHPARAGGAAFKWTGGNFAWLRVPRVASRPIVDHFLLSSAVSIWLICAIDAAGRCYLS